MALAPAGPLRLLLAAGLLRFPLLSAAIALDLKVADFALPSPIWALGNAEITPGPALRAVKAQLNKRDITSARFPCADSCLSSAVTKSTTCTVGDYACQCEPSNALIINEGADSCVVAACGAAIANRKCPSPKAARGSIRC